MKNITIKQTPSLTDLAFALDRSPGKMVEDILGIAKKHRYVADDFYESGFFLVDLMVKYGDIQTPDGAATLCLGKCGILKKKNKEFNITKLFSELVLWGTGDCPECGYWGELSPNNKRTVPEYQDASPPEIIGDEKYICLNCNCEFTKN